MAMMAAAEATVVVVVVEAVMDARRLLRLKETDMIEDK